MDKKTTPSISQEDYQKLTLLLAEKRTSHTTLRSGLALCAFSMTLITFTIFMDARFVGDIQRGLLIALGVASVPLLVLGSYFVHRGLTHLRFHDQMINSILYKNPEFAAIFYSTRNMHTTQPKPPEK